MTDNKNRKVTKMTHNPFGYENLETMTGFLFWQVSHVWYTNLEKMLKLFFNISLLHYVILSSTYWLNAMEGVKVTQAYLSLHTKVEKMTISKNIAELQERGFLIRSRHSTDLRANIVTISESGLELLEKAIVEIEKMDNTFFNVLKRRRALFNSHLLEIIKENRSFFL
jgi:DNA-binding MarR family transcriptional regulator